MKELIKQVARHAGLEVRRYGIDSSAEFRLQKLLRHHRVDAVIDVGANTGQYAQVLRERGYAGRIVSYEPLSAAHEVLVRNAASDPKWTVAPRCAVGDCDGEVDINVSQNLVSSSILSLNEQHVAAAPDSRFVSRERVPLVRLDSVAADLGEARRAFLKIDTQGFEGPVIDGASGVLVRIQGMQLEMSLASVYVGQILLADMVLKLATLGFELHALFPGHSDPVSGRLLQADGVFFRGDSNENAGLRVSRPS